MLAPWLDEDDDTVSKDSFSVNLVPHTLKETALSGCRVGSRLNLEVDIIARYAARLLAG
jgi:riboflavin synthase